MTKPLSTCRACGRDDGHYIGCPNSPRPGEIIVNAFEPLPPEKLCAEDGCAAPKGSSRSNYCTEHGSRAAYNARAYQKRKEPTDG